MSDIGEKVAKKYARALFESFDTSQLENVEKALHGLATIWKEDEGIRLTLLSPTVLSSEKEKALQEVGKLVGESYGVSPSEHLSRFLNLVDGNGRIAGIPEISKCFSSLLREMKKELQVTVISATSLGDDEKQSIQSEIASESSGLSEVEWLVDEAIIGGAIIRCGDKEIDGSVRGAISGARSSLLQ